MPTYQNTSDRPINIGGKHLSIGESVEMTRQFKYYDLVNVGNEVRYFGDVEGSAITITSEEPYHVLAKDYHEITFSGAETQSITPVSASGDGLLDAKVLRVRTDVALTIKTNSTSNPYAYPLAANDSIDILNDNKIKSLYLTSSGAGSATVIELARREDSVWRV